MLIHNSILDKQADLICITKTSVEEMKRTSLFTICLPNFIIQYQPRLNVREGEGGITVINRSEISLTRCLSSTLRVLSVFTWDWVTKTGWDSFWSTGPPHFTPTGQQFSCKSCQIWSPMWCWSLPGWWSFLGDQHPYKGLTK